MDNSLDGLMKQAKEMQEKMERFRSEASNSEVTGESGAGLVSVRMSGSHDVRSVKIDKSLLSEEKQVLEGARVYSGRGSRKSYQEPLGALEVVVPRW